MSKPEIISYQGKSIVYLDFTNMRDKELIVKKENEGAAYIRSQPEKSVYTLTNMEGMLFNNDLKKYFEDVAKGNAPYVKAGAIIGMTGLISIMYNAFVTVTGRDIKSFKTKEDALKYLASK